MTVPLILASGSPRRRDLFKQAGLTFEIIISNVPEDHDAGLSPEATALYLAELKASDVAAYHPRRWVIGADTIVVLDNEILGKPANQDIALIMLKKLNHQTHIVITAVSIINRKKNVNHAFAETSYVTFKNNPLAVIENYARTQEPLDKAGGYAVQGSGSELIAQIKGDRNNVIGFPLKKFLDYYQTQIQIFYCGGTLF